jgi:hypothetical protein
MEKTELESKLKIALAVFLNQHSDLLKIDVSERSIAHKFAECLKIFFHRFDIDCEYNRHIGQEKRLDGVKDFVRAKRKSGELSDNEEDFGICVSPDVIIHKRMTDELNLLIIEIKKTGHPLQEREYDHLKICSYIKEINYKYGLFLEFDVNDHAGVKKALLFLPGNLQNPENITAKIRG